jgi:diguanylate cyclase (GGDEF)-like protein
LTDEPRLHRRLGGQRHLGKVVLLSGAVIVFATCLALSVSKTITEQEAALRAGDPHLQLAFMADYEIQRLRHSFDVYALDEDGIDHDTLTLRLQRAQRTLQRVEEAIGRPGADEPREVSRMVENLSRLGSELLAFEPGDPVRRAQLATRLDDTAIAVHRIVTDAEAASLDDTERTTRRRWLYLEEALYLLGMLASGGVFIGMLLRESRNTRRLLAEATAAQVRIEHLAHHDPLTDLPNRWLFKDRLDQALRVAQRQGGPVAMHCIDVDFFKTVNDRDGHVTGDQLLVAAARRMQECLRESDTLARLGGDEFAIVQTGPTAMAAEPLAERLLKAFRVPLTADGHKLKATVSIGIGLYPEHATTAEALHRAADPALYWAKTAGRDQYHVWQPGDDRAGFPVRYRALAG